MNERMHEKEGREREEEKGDGGVEERERCRLYILYLFSLAGPKSNILFTVLCII